MSAPEEASDEEDAAPVAQPPASSADEGVIFVLESASLEVAKVGKVSSTGQLQPQRWATKLAGWRAAQRTTCCGHVRKLVPGTGLAAHCKALTSTPARAPTFWLLQGYQLLNCDDHAGFLRRHGKDPALHRPDICHQVPALHASAVACWGDPDAYRQQLCSLAQPTLAATGLSV